MVKKEKATELGTLPVEGLQRIEALSVNGVKLDGVYVMHRRDREGKIVRLPLDAYTWKTEKSPASGPRFVILSSTSFDQRYADARLNEHPEVFAAGLKKRQKPELKDLLTQAQAFVNGK